MSSPQGSPDVEMALAEERLNAPTASEVLLSVLKQLEARPKEDQIKVMRGLAAFLELEQGDIF